MSDYENFIAGKYESVRFDGIEASWLPPSMFPHQRDLTRWALKKGRSALFAATGLGKSIMALAWARNVADKHGRVLILTPLAVAQQFVREGAKFDVPCRYLRADDGEPGVVVTNYEMVERFDTSAFSGVVLDECFAGDTLIDTPSGPKEIRSISIGERILNAYGEDIVSDVHRREVPFATKVSIQGASCVTSPNHPFFTQRGWVGAQDLRAGDYALGTAAAVRLVREGVLSEIPGGERAEVLRSILLSELADAPAGCAGEGAQPRSGRTSREEPIQVSKVWERELTEGTGPHPRPEPHDLARGQSQTVPPIEGHEPQTFRTWWKRTWPDGATGADDEHSRPWMGAGVELVIGSTDSWLSNELQGRYRESRAENRRRGGWSVSSQSQSPGRQEGCETGFARVDGVEILEQGHPEMDCLRDADGKLYFYDIGATRHPSFSVNGFLVHNSSILKSFDGKTRNQIIGLFKDTPYRLAATATPAPNDYAELGNHSEFLGIKTRAEMLAEFFVHDGETTQEWRLKGHAQDAFWRWVASWGAIIQLPSDLGHDDGAYALPPLRMVEHVIPVDVEDAHRAGHLFAAETRTLMDQRANRRATMTKRVRKAAEIAGSSEPCIVWAELNAEADAAEAAITDAVQVSGSDTLDEKIDTLNAFVEGRSRVLVGKASIIGFGMNFQHCARMVFLGASHSFEQTFQAIRRCWRFGQTKPVEVHIIRAENETAIMANYRRKEADYAKMAQEMREHSRAAVRAEVQGASAREWNPYEAHTNIIIPEWVRTQSG